MTKIETRAANVRCDICARTFRTNSGLLEHLNFCRRRNRHEGDKTNGKIQTNNNNHEATFKGQNGKSGNRMKEMIEIRGIKVEMMGMRGIQVGMRGMLGIREGMPEIAMKCRELGVRMKGIRVRIFV